MSAAGRRTDGDRSLPKGRSPYKVPLVIPPSPLIHAGPTLAPLADRRSRGSSRTRLPPSPAPAPSSTHLSESPADESGFSPLTASCFTVNYIMGTGFLTLPWAFVSAGLALSVVVIFFVTFFAYVSMVYMLEVMARAEGVTRESSLAGTPVPGPPPSPLVSLPASPAAFLNAAAAALSTPQQRRATAAARVRQRAAAERAGEAEEGRRLVGNGGSYGSLPRTAPVERAPPVAAAAPAPAKPVKPAKPVLVGARKFEVPELCLMFCGSQSLVGYMAATGLYLYGALWAYASVFANALESSDLVSGCGYAGFIALFSAIVVPLSLLDLREQIAVQVSLSGCRLLMVLAMVGSIMGDALAGPEAFHFDPAVAHQDPPLVRWGGAYILLPIAAYASIFHHSIPGLSQPVADRAQLASIFGNVFVFTAASYCLIGLVVGYYFGDDIQTSCNINWGGYHGGTGTLVQDADGTQHRTDVALWAKALSAYVVLFPALDVVSAFPLNAITLGNNLLGAHFGEKIHEAEKSWHNRTRFRCYACLPPIFGALLVRDLGTITDFTGVTGFAIAFSFPALLSIYSKRMVEEHFPRLTTTGYHNGFSNEQWALTVFFFGVVLVVFVLGCLIWEASGGFLLTIGRNRN